MLTITMANAIMPMGKERLTSSSTTNFMATEYASHVPHTHTLLGVTKWCCKREKERGVGPLIVYWHTVCQAMAFNQKTHDVAMEFPAELANYHTLPPHTTWLYSKA